MLYGIPPVRMIELATLAAINFSKTFKDAIAIKVLVSDRDDPIRCSIKP